MNYAMVATHTVSDGMRSLTDFRKQLGQPAFCTATAPPSLTRRRRFLRFLRMGLKVWVGRLQPASPAVLSIVRTLPDGRVERTGKPQPAQSDEAEVSRLWAGSSFPGFDWLGLGGLRTAVVHHVFGHTKRGQLLTRFSLRHGEISFSTRSTRRLEPVLPRGGSRQEPRQPWQILYLLILVATKV